jgi:hypothetical protein
VDILSGASRDVLETTDAGGVAMNREGVILLGSALGGLRRVGRDGAAQVITTPDQSRHEIWHAGPVFLPDGNRFLYISFARDPSAREQPRDLYAGALDSRESRLIGPIPSGVQYVEPGCLLFVRDGTLMSVRFDSASLTMSGEPARVADGVSYFKPTGVAEFSASLNGVVTYRPPVGGQTLTWVDRVGQQYPFDISPDGRIVLLGSIDYEGGTGADLYTAPADGSAPPAPFVRTPFNEANGRFSPDGRTVAYHSNEPGTFQVYTRPFLGPGRARQVSTAGGTTPRWSPDGRQLYFRRGTSIFFADMTSEDAEPRLLFDTGRAFVTYEIAPDGERFLLAMADEAAEQVPTRILVNWPSMIDAAR